MEDKAIFEEELGVLELITAAYKVYMRIEIEEPQRQFFKYSEYIMKINLTA